MKKLISVFAALALVGSLAAQKKPAAKAPAKPAAPAAPAVAAPAAPVVAAPSVPAAPAASGKGIGLRIGLGLGYSTNIGNRGTDNATLGSFAGGGGYEANLVNAGFTGSGTGKSSANSGIDANLVIEYDILPWLFVRSGVGRATGLKNTYTMSRTVGGATENLTVTTNANQLEIPGLVGLNLINTSTGSLYFAAGVALIQADYTATVSATNSTGTAYKDVENKISPSTLGFNYIIGGRVKISDGINLFGEVKFLNASAAGVEKERTKNDGTSTYATSSPVFTAIPTLGFSPSVEAAADTKRAITGADLSYTRWNVGIQYEL